MFKLANPQQSKVKKNKKINQSDTSSLIKMRHARLVAIMLLGVTGFLSTQCSYAESIDNPAHQIHFNDNSSVSFQASSSNINRIFVEGDRIIKHVAPQGTFVFDKALSKNGSLYFKPIYADTPFTIFFTTEKGHHFSALISPIGTTGQTVQMIPNNVTDQDVRWEKGDGYLKLLQSIMLSMIQDKGNSATKGITGQVVADSKPFSGYPDTQMKLIKVYQAGQVDGFVYGITNTSKLPVHLYERKFWRDGVRAVSISQSVLAPQHTGYVYTILTTKG